MTFAFGDKGITSLSLEDAIDKGLKVRFYYCMEGKTGKLDSSRFGVRFRKTLLILS